MRAYSIEKRPQRFLKPLRSRKVIKLLNLQGFKNFVGLNKKIVIPNKEGKSHHEIVILRLRSVQD